MSEQYKDSLVDIQERWSMRDLLDAHDILDLVQDAERKHHDDLERERESLRGRR